MLFDDERSLARALVEAMSATFVALSNTFWLNKPQSASARRKPQCWRGEYESILSASVALLDRVANVEPGQRVRSRTYRRPIE
jgi:hypothetical protein